MYNLMMMKPLRIQILKYLIQLMGWSFLLFPGLRILILSTLQQSSIAGNDFVVQFIPWWTFLRKSICAGTFPWWDTSVMAGYPVLADPQSAVLYPLNWIFLIPMSVEIILTVLVVLHLWIAAVLMYFWLRHRGLNQIPGFIGAFIFSCSGFMMAHAGAGHYSLICAAAWLPGILWITEAAVRRASTHLVLLSGILTGIQLSCGHIQVTVITVLSSLILVLSSGRKTMFKRLAATWIIPVLLGTLIYAGPIATAWELHSFSSRSDMADKSKLASKDAFPPENIAGFIFWNIQGGAPGTQYHGRESFHETFNYIGVIPVVCLLFAELRKHKFPWILMVFSLFAASAPMFPPAAKLISSLPGIGTMRGWSRWILALDLSVALLAAEGLNGIYQSLKIKFNPSSGMVLFAISVPGILLFSPSGFRGHTAAAITGYSGIKMAIFALLFVAGTAIFSKKSRFVGFPAFILILGFFEMWECHSTFLQVSQNTYQAVLDTAGDCLKSIPGNDRVVINEMPISVNRYGIYGKDSLTGYRPLPLGRFEEYFNLADGKPRATSQVFAFTSSASRLTRLASVRWFIGPKDPQTALDFEKNTNCGSIPVYEDTLALPRAFFVNRFEVIPEIESLLSRLTSETWDPSETVLLETHPGSISAPAVTWSSGTADIVSKTHDAIAIAPREGQHGILVLTDAWYPGWMAYADEKRADCLRADFLFRAVVVPESTKKVVFRYEPGWRYWVWIISFIEMATALMAGAWLFILRKNRME